MPVYKEYYKNDIHYTVFKHYFNNYPEADIGFGFSGISLSDHVMYSGYGNTDYNSEKIPVWLTHYMGAMSYALHSTSTTESSYAFGIKRSILSTSYYPSHHEVQLIQEWYKTKRIAAYNISGRFINLHSMSNWNLLLKLYREVTSGRLDDVVVNENITKALKSIMRSDESLVTKRRIFIASTKEKITGGTSSNDELINLHPHETNKELLDTIYTTHRKMYGPEKLDELHDMCKFCQFIRYNGVLTNTTNLLFYLMVPRYRIIHNDQTIGMFLTTITEPDYHRIMLFPSEHYPTVRHPNPCKYFIDAPWMSDALGKDRFRYPGAGVYFGSKNLELVKSLYNIREACKLYARRISSDMKIQFGSRDPTHPDRYWHEQVDDMITLYPYVHIVSNSINHIHYHCIIAVGRMSFQKFKKLVPYNVSKLYNSKNESIGRLPVCLPLDTYIDWVMADEHWIDDIITKGVIDSPKFHIQSGLTGLYISKVDTSIYSQPIKDYWNNVRSTKLEIQRIPRIVDIPKPVDMDRTDTVYTELGFGPNKFIRSNTRLFDTAIYEIVATVLNYIDPNHTIHGFYFEGISMNRSGGM